MVTDQNSRTNEEPAGATVATAPAENQAPATEPQAPGDAAAQASQATSGQGTQGTEPDKQQAAQQQTDEGGLLKAEPEATAEDKAEEKDKPSPVGAPEAYDIKPVEGVDPGIKAGHPVFDAFLEAARDLDLSNDAAQALYSKVAPVLAGRPAEAVRAVRRTGIEATKADAEIGGEKFAENLKVAGKAYNDARFVTPALRELLQQTGLDSHPEVVRLMYRIGKQTGEGQFFRTRGESSGPEDYRQRYPNTRMNR